MVLVAEKHVCHPKIMYQIEEHLNRAIREEISTFEDDTRAFWRSKDVKFYEDLLNKGKKEL